MFHAIHGAKLFFDIHSIHIILLCLNNPLPFQITFNTSKSYLCFMIHFKLWLLASAQILNHCIIIGHFPFHFCFWLRPSWVSLLFHGDDANNSPVMPGLRRNNTCVRNFRQSLPEGKCALVWRANAYIPTPSAAFTVESIYLVQSIIFKLKTYMFKQQCCSEVLFASSGATSQTSLGLCACCPGWSVSLLLGLAMSFPSVVSRLPTMRWVFQQVGNERHLPIHLLLCLCKLTGL